MAHLMFVRKGADKAFQILLQRRGRGVNEGSTWGLPGGSLDGAERSMSRDRNLSPLLQWYARRRAVIREAIEEAGDPDRGPNFEVYLPELQHGEQFSPAVLTRACLPFGMARALDDWHGIWIRGIVPSSPGTFYFVYLISEPGDGPFFCGSGEVDWQPRAQPQCRWENDEAFRGGGCTLGYCWAPLADVMAAAAGGSAVAGCGGRLCSWVGQALGDASVAAAVLRHLRELALLRDPPPPPRPVRLLALPFRAARQAGERRGEPRTGPDALS